MLQVQLLFALARICKCKKAGSGLHWPYESCRIDRQTTAGRPAKVSTTRDGLGWGRSVLLGLAKSQSRIRVSLGSSLQGQPSSRLLRPSPASCQTDSARKSPGQTHGRIFPPIEIVTFITYDKDQQQHGAYEGQDTISSSVLLVTPATSHRSNVTSDTPRSNCDLGSFRPFP